MLSNPTTFGAMVKKYMHVCVHKRKTCLAVSTAVENLTSQASQRQHEQIMQVFCRRLNDMGCILPSEPTSASVATAALVAQHGQRAVLLSDSEIDNAFQSVKIRLKQLYKNEPVKFIQTLPATPGELVRTEHAFALTIFSREEPPADCPLCNTTMDHVRARISMRRTRGCI